MVDLVKILLVGVKGLEPSTSWSQTRRASQLRHTPVSTGNRGNYTVFS